MYDDVFSIALGTKASSEGILLNLVQVWYNAVIGVGNITSVTILEDVAPSDTYERGTMALTLYCTSDTNAFMIEVRRCARPAFPGRYSDAAKQFSVHSTFFRRVRTYAYALAII